MNTANNDNPTWKPLENAMLSMLLPDFMFMGTTEFNGKTLYLYKNRNTRKYMNVDMEGVFYEYTGEGYEPFKDSASDRVLTNLLSGISRLIGD